MVKMDDRHSGSMGYRGGAVYWFAMGAGAVLCTQIVVAWDDVYPGAHWWEIVSALGSVTAVIVALYVAWRQQRSIALESRKKALLLAFRLKIEIDDLHSYSSKIVLRLQTLFDYEDAVRERSRAPDLRDAGDHCEWFAALSKKNREVIENRMNEVVALASSYPLETLLHLQTNLAAPVAQAAHQAQRLNRLLRAQKEVAENRDTPRSDVVDMQLQYQQHLNEVAQLLATASARLSQVKNAL